MSREEYESIIKVLNSKSECSDYEGFSCLRSKDGRGGMMSKEIICIRLCSIIKDFCEKEEKCEDCSLRHISDNIEHYAKLHEENRLIELPCKVGDTVWIVRENIYEATVHRVVLSISESDNFINLDVGYEYVDWFYDDGRKATATALCRYLRDAFLTKEEAEAKLMELKGEKDG